MSPTKLKLAAERLDISESTLRRLVKAGQVRAIHLGKQLFISDSEMQRLEEHGVEGGPKDVSP